MRLPPAAVASLVLTLGCGGGLFTAPESGAGGGDDLRRQNLELRREKTVAEVELARLRQEVARLEAELATLRERHSRQPPPIEDSTGAADVAFEPSTVEEEELLDDELAAAPPPRPAPPRPAPPRPAPPPSASPPSTSPAGPVGAEARALYDESYALFHEQRYQESEDGFERFLELYPDTDLADNAQYWIGECRFARGELDSALEAFMRTVEIYPDGNKVPDALLKAGRCLEGLGDGPAAKATYEEIVRRFGSSAAAASARDRLGEMR